MIVGHKWKRHLNLTITKEWLIKEQLPRFALITLTVSGSNKNLWLTQFKRLPLVNRKKDPRTVLIDENFYGAVLDKDFVLAWGNSANAAKNQRLCP